MRARAHTHTHTHTCMDIYIYIYTYIKILNYITNSPILMQLYLDVNWLVPQILLNHLAAFVIQLLI